MDAIIEQKTRTKRTLSCLVVVGAFHSPDHLDKAAKVAWGKFTEDMKKQGWHLIDDQVYLDGPRPYVPLRTLPKLSEQMKMHPYEVIQEVPTLETAEKWMYLLKADFWRDLPRAEFLVTSPGEMPVEYPTTVQNAINAVSDSYLEIPGRN